jgi:adenosylhomocysteine nucleosidase
MLGLISAMKVEMELIAAALENGKMEYIGGVEFQTGSLWGHEAVLCVCGPGKVNAAMCTQAMIQRYHPEAVLNLGVAGSLSDKVSIGDVVVGTYAVQHDMDTSPLGDPPGYISGINLIRLPLDHLLQDKLRRALSALSDIKGIFGGVATGDQFLHNAAHRVKVREQFEALCCEMEGGAVAHVCHVNGVPCAIVRAISDNADGGSDVDFLKFVNHAAENSVRLVKRFLQEA